MSTEAIIAYALALSLFAASPGPGVFATIGHAMTRGAGPAFALLSGLIAADILYLVAAALGLAAAAAEMGDLFTLVRLAGAAYLIWLGWTSWTKSYSDEPSASPNEHSKSFLGGFAISLSNPKVMVFYLAFLPTFIDLRTITAQDVALLASITAGLSYVVLGVYIFGARRLSRALQRKTVRRRFDQGAGSLLIAAGLLVATRN